MTTDVLLGTFWADKDVLYLDSDGVAYVFVKTQQAQHLTWVILSRIHYISMKLILKKAAQFGLRSWTSFLVQDKEAKGPRENLALQQYHSPDLLFRETKENKVKL